MTRKQRIWWYKYGFYIAGISFVIGFWATMLIMAPKTPITIQYNIVKNTPTPSLKPAKQVIYGHASWYSLDGCLGCRDDRLMANGEVLDDTKLTVAYNRAPLNTYLEITNTANDKTITAKVTDTGGFERHGKIIDLSVATRDALGCGDVCHVKLVLDNNITNI